VVQRRHGTHLLRKTLQAIALIAEGFGKNLEGHISAEPRVLGEIHFSHPAGTKRS
jgi:hypothetical protein